MNKYRVGLHEEIGGTIVVEAENQEQAEELADEMLNEYGCDRLFYPVKGVDDDIFKYNGNHRHGDRSVESCEIMAVDSFPIGNDADFGKSME